MPFVMGSVQGRSYRGIVDGATLLMSRVSWLSGATLEEKREGTKDTKVHEEMPYEMRACLPGKGITQNAIGFYILVFNSFFAPFAVNFPFSNSEKTNSPQRRKERKGRE